MCGFQHLSPDGFGNLRFAALANVASGVPFMPAAYHGGGKPSFAIATEAADLALALRLDKPLTARLMPMPGKIAGDAISFNFPYFANGNVMDHRARALGNLLAEDEQFDLRAI